MKINNILSDIIADNQLYDHGPRPEGAQVEGVKAA